jgi:hypothetical protein
LVSAATALAQSSGVTGTLEGIVADASGGRIPGVTVKIRAVETNHAYQTTTNDEGIFRFTQLQPGSYATDMQYAGFASYSHAGIRVTLGSTTHLDVVLQLVAGDTITVTAQPPAIDATQTSVTSAVDTEKIEELPVESRNYLNFVLLVPGVASSVPPGARQASGALPASGFTFGGLRGRSNNIAIDGLDNNDEYAGSSRTELSLETVQEFQVVNSGLSAETGGASGGSINVITRVGANKIHGDAFLFAQNGATNARQPFEAESQPPNLHRYRLGLALGGPIVKDRTFYYAGFEQEHNRSLEDSYVNPAAVAAINRYFATVNPPVLGVLTTRRLSDDPFPTARAETEASFKVNHQLTGRNSVMARYAYTNNRESGDAFNTGGLIDPSARGSSFTEDQSVVGSLTSVFTPQSVGDFRFQLATRRVVLRTNDAVGRGVDISGVVSFGRPYEGNGRRTEDHYQGAYSFTHAAGHHLVKAGATLNHVSLDAAMADGFGGLLIFGSLSDFMAGLTDSLRQASGKIDTSFAVTNYGAFVQDHWSVARNLTVDLGLRYDFESLPGVFHEDRNNFSPRVGLAYHVAPDWMVRAGYGIFFDRYVLASLNRVLQKDGASGVEEVFRRSALALVPSVYTADKGLATPYSQQSSFAVEHLLAPDLTATASYLFVRGVKLSRTRNINTSGPLFHDIFQLEDSASSTYQGASFALNRRLANEFELSASYTLSKTYDDASDFTEQPQNPFDLRAERAVSLQHQQQRFVMSALWELPIGDQEPGQPAPHDWFTRVFGHIELAPILTVESGRPVNPLTGIDTYMTFAYPLSARPPGFGRNSLRTPGQGNMDLRLLKFFPCGGTSKLDLVGEAFNLFNHTNVSQINAVFGPAFRQPIAAAGARRVQFSLDFEF